MTEKHYMARRAKPSTNNSKTFHVRRRTERTTPRTCSNSIYNHGTLSVTSRSKKNGVIEPLERVDPSTFLYMGESGEHALRSDFIS